MKPIPELRAIAHLASRGPWHTELLDVVSPDGVVSRSWACLGKFQPEEANANHIAAFDRPTALTLLDAWEAAELARQALWVCAEHNALHHGENHNTVIQARSALAAIDAAMSASKEPTRAAAAVGDERERT